jgi:hypothetical protein
MPAQTGAVPGMVMVAPFAGRKVGLLLDLTGATGVVHLYFNDVAGGNMVNRGVLANGLPKTPYRFGVSLHSAGSQVSWVGFQDQDILV